VRAWSGRLVRLRRTRVPSGVASSADRARARRRQRFFFTFREQQRVASRQSRHLRSSVSRNAARCSACRRFVCHVSGRVFRRSRLVRDAVSEKRESAQGKKKSFVQSTSFFSVFSRRTLFSLVRVSLRRSFSRRDFCASPRMPPQSRVSAQVVRNIFGRGDSEAGTQRRAGSAFDSTRARTTAHTHRRR
jgi:hypothetical protein